MARKHHTSNHHHTTSNHHSVFDDPRLLVHPHQKVLHQDLYSHPHKQFGNQLAPTVMQYFPTVNAKFFTDTINEVNACLEGWQLSEKMTYLECILCSLLILTFGLFLVIYIPLAFIMTALREKKAKERFQLLTQMIQKMNDSQLKTLGLEWNILKINSYYVLRLIHTANTIIPEYTESQNFCNLNEQELSMEPVKCYNSSQF